MISKNLEIPAVNRQSPKSFYRFILPQTEFKALGRVKMTVIVCITCMANDMGGCYPGIFKEVKKLQNSEIDSLRNIYLRKKNYTLKITLVYSNARKFSPVIFFPQ